MQPIENLDWLHFLKESDSSSVGRAAASQAAGRGFEPRLSLKRNKTGE